MSKQNISSLALILWELLKEEDESWLSLIKFWQFFPAPRQKYKNLLGNFFAINMRSLYEKFQPLKLREYFEDGGRTVKMQNFKQTHMEQKFY